MQIKKEILLHTAFGISTPIPGFENPIGVLEKPVGSTYIPKLNPNHVFNGDFVSRVLRSFGARENIMIVGDKGTGKSSFVQQFCARLNIPLIVISGGPGLDETYLVGSKTIENGSVKSVDGVLSYAMRHGIPVLIDELAAIRPSVLVAINDILNGDEVVTLKHHGLDPALTPDQLAEMENGMTIKRNPAFRIFATDNTGGKLGRNPLYAGVNVQNTAVRSRFTCFKLGYMAPAEELKALMGATENALPLMVAKQMIEFAIRARAAAETGQATDTLSFRELQRWGRKALVYGTFEMVGTVRKVRPNIAKACVDAFFTALEETDQDVYKVFYEDVFATPLELPDEYTQTASSFLTALSKNTIDWGDVAA